MRRSTHHPSSDVGIEAVYFYCDCLFTSVGSTVMPKVRAYSADFRNDAGRIGVYAIEATKGSTELDVNNYF